LATSRSFERKAKSRHLTNSLAASALVLACATYEEPGRLGDDPLVAAGASMVAGAPPATAGALNSSSGSGTTAGAGGTTDPSIAGRSGSGGSAESAGNAGTSEGGQALGEGGSAGAGTVVCAECAGLVAALVHRYDFEGEGTVVSDRVGTAHGEVVGAATLSRGVLVLEGGADGSYVNLPNGLLSQLTSASLETWVTWSSGTAAWQRVFDFGDSSAASPEDNPANGKSYLFLTPMTDAGSGGLLRAVYSLSGGSAMAETRVEGPSSLPLALAQLMVVVDSASGRLLLYVDGAPVGEQASALSLSSIHDVNCWLGRSQYAADPELGATLHDFRIYDAALTPAQIAASFAGGPDPAFLTE
jgi:hypothetical protein